MCDRTKSVCLRWGAIDQQNGPRYADAFRDCNAHGVNWRIRCLAAERERDALRARIEKAEQLASRNHELLVDVARAVDGLGQELTAIPGLVRAVVERAEKAERILLLVRRVVERGPRNGEGI
jgi:hypothetical protein